MSVISIQELSLSYLICITALQLTVPVSSLSIDETDRLVMQYASSHIVPIDCNIVIILNCQR